MSRLRSVISSEEVLRFVCPTELDGPILPQEDPRWGRLRPGVDSNVNLRERFRGG